MTSNLSFEQFCDEFNDEQICIDALFSARWPQGFRCPKCAHPHCYEIHSRRLPLYECRSCRSQTSLIVGTIMEGSRTPLRLWFQAIFLHARPRGISASRLAEVMGTTYKTAWLICHKIRHAMSASDAGELLDGIVRINSGAYGKPHNPTVFRHPQKQPLLAGVSMDDKELFSHVKIKHVPDDYLIHDRITNGGKRDFIERYVAPEATIISAVILEYSPDRYRPLIQLCQQAGNWINYMFNGIGPKHLQSYLDQFCFGLNNRERSSSPFHRLLQWSVSSLVVTYPDLISRVDHSAIHKSTYSKLLKEAC
ncbi:transposase [Cohnella cellulosilytica]|uniref:Transposase n=1 Tax=Cohnella cellulosilytica TaxID=986710 RepID=A0ABW2F7H3_9BACL